MHRLLIITLNCSIICTALISCSKTSIKQESIDELPITNIIKPINSPLPIGFLSFKAKDTFAYTSSGYDNGSFKGVTENKPGPNFTPFYDESSSRKKQVF